MSDITSFFNITFADKEDTIRGKEITKYDLPDKKEYTVAYMTYSPQINGIFLSYPHRNPLLNFTSKIDNKILDSATAQLEIFNKFLKQFQKKILNSIVLKNFLKLEYIPQSLTRENETLYLGINPRFKKNSIYNLLTLYLMAVHDKMYIQPKIDEKFFAQFYYNRTMPTVNIPLAAQPAPDIDPLLKSLIEPVPNPVVAYEQTLVDETNAPQIAITKNIIVEEILREHEAKGLPPPIRDFDEVNSNKRPRLSSSTSSTLSSNESESEMEEDEDSEDERMSKATEINLNRHFQKTLQMSNDGKSDISSIGSSIIKNFKDMHLNTSEFSRPLITYINSKFETVAARTEAIEKLKTLFATFIKDNTNDVMLTEEQIEKTRIDLLEQITNDNTKLQTIILKAKNGCVESIYLLFVVVLQTNILLN